MKSEILIEIEKNYKEMQDIIAMQKFSAGDAQRFLDRYFNYVRKMEQLIISRDIWKKKYEELKKKS